jgi:hypothetical protein
MDVQTKRDITKAMGLVCDRIVRMKDIIMETKPVSTKDIWDIIDEIFKGRNDVDIISNCIDLIYDFNECTRITRKSCDRLLTSDNEIQMDIQAHTSVITASVWLSSLFVGKPFSLGFTVHAIRCGDIHCEVPMYQGKVQVPMRSAVICLKDICRAITLDGGTFPDLCPVLTELVQYWMYG